MQKIFICFLWLIITHWIQAADNWLLGIAPFVSDNITYGEVLLLQERVQNVFRSEWGGNILSCKNIEKHLETFKMSAGTLLDQEEASWLGIRLGVQYLLTGSVIGTEAMYVFRLKVLNIGKKEYLFVKTMEKSSVKELMPEIDLVVYDIIKNISAVSEESGGNNGIELYIRSDPQGADISLDNRPLGTAPLFIKINQPGLLKIEARKEAMYGCEYYESASGVFNEISIKMDVVYGRLFIDCPEQPFTVFIDDAYCEVMQEGLIRKVMAGKHTIKLAGNDFIWQGEVQIKQDTTTVLAVQPVFTGSFTYTLPPGITGELKGTAFSARLSGSGTLTDLPQGQYSLFLDGSDYYPLQETISIARGNTVSYIPVLEHTAEFLIAVELKRQREKAAEEQAVREKAQAERTEALEELKIQLNKTMGYKRFLNISRQSALITGCTLLVLSGISFTNMFIQNDQYNNSLYSSELIMHRENAAVAADWGWGLGLSGVICGGLWLLLPFLEPDTGELNRQWQQLQ